MRIDRGALSARYYCVNLPKRLNILVVILSPFVSRISYFSRYFLIEDDSWNFHEESVLTGSNVSIDLNTCLSSWLSIPQWKNFNELVTSVRANCIGISNWRDYYYIPGYLPRAPNNFPKWIFVHGRRKGVSLGTHQLVHLPRLSRI